MHNFSISQFVNFSACDACEEWYHGDCIYITEKEAKHIKHYYCQGCKEEDPTLQTVFRAVPVAVAGITPEERKAKKLEKSSKMREKVAREAERKKEKHKEKIGKSKDRCGNCVACTSPSCGECDGCLSGGRKQRCDRQICYNSKKAKAKGAATRTKRRRRSVSPDIFLNPALEGDRHCHGPQCRLTARPQSKYCSDACGLKMATSRIYQVLPQRLQEWNFSECVAEEKNKRQLEVVRGKQVIVRATLTELDKRQKELDLLVERAKHCTLDPKSSDNAEEDEMSMYCITCGHEIHSRTAIRHMEKCFNKYESQASFGSIFKTKLEGNSMFCDFFNLASNTYCKRLRVLCPEHSKKDKISDTDVCGCPLVKNVFELTGEFCRAPKKNCFKHYAWEKIRRAEIDLERVREYLKLDELLEQERQVRQAMASRANVLGLMLHSTYNHEIMERLIRMNSRTQ